MALFSVQRYLGDTGDDVDKKVRAANILEKLQAEAKARKLNKGLTTLPIDIGEQAKSSVEKAKLRKEEHTEKEQENIDQTRVESNDTFTESHVKHEHKKRKAHSDSVSKGFDEDDAEKRKQKNRKHKHSPDIHTEVNASKLEGLKLSKKRKKLESKLKAENISNNHETNVELEGTDKNNLKKKHKKEKKKNVQLAHSEDRLSTDDNDVSSVKKSTEIKHHLDADMASDHSDKDGAEDLENEITDKTDDIGGFTVIGSVKPGKVEKVKRVLPDWLANPSVISADLTSDHLPVLEMPGLDQSLVQKLQANNITQFFPVQQQVIPALLDSTRSGFLVGRGGYRPSDICVSAPTGSGKTLAFVLPIVQALKARVTCEVRALIVLPVRDLATQVFKVFQTYCEGTCLKVGLLTGIKAFQVEQQSLVKKRLRGYQSMFDIIVATPGRLVDHINRTEGFSLARLRFLVIDEADRMVDEIKQDWLTHVESAVWVGTRHRPSPLTANSCEDIQTPLQKLLYSATLSQNPEKLQQLNLFQPKLFTSVVKATESRKHSAPRQSKQQESGEMMDTTEEKDTEAPPSPVRGDFVGKYTTPAGLTEHYIETTAEQKPLIVLHLLHDLKFRHVLCFTNSIEATHRLYWVIKLVGGISVKEFSSRRTAGQRDKLLQKFAAGKIDIIICSDAMARGMDINNVKYVISYDPPPFIKTYVHRIGRTARAGKEGCAISLLQKKEFYHFKKMVREAGKSNAQAMKVHKQDLKSLIPQFKAALKQLPDVLKQEKKRTSLNPSSTVKGKGKR